MCIYIYAHITKDIYTYVYICKYANLNPTTIEATALLVARPGEDGHHEVPDFQSPYSLGEPASTSLLEQHPMPPHNASEHDFVNSLSPVKT